MDKQMSFWHTWLQAQNVLLCLEFSSILFRTRHNRDWISFLPPVFLQTVQSVSSPAAQTPFWLLFFSWKTCWLCKLPYSLDCMFFFLYVCSCIMITCVLEHFCFLSGCEGDETTAQGLIWEKQFLSFDRKLHDILKAKFCLSCWSEAVIVKISRSGVDFG